MLMGWLGVVVVATQGLMEIDEDGKSLGEWGGGDHEKHDHKGF